jgi:RNase P protein component
MPPKALRLKTKEFKTLPKGVLFRGRYFDLKKIDSVSYKLACVVSKQLAKSSVARNKARRVFYNALFQATKGKSGIFVVYPKKEGTLTKYDTLLKELQNTID